MRPIGANTVGRVSVEFEVANYGDLTLAERGLLPADQVRAKSSTALSIPVRRSWSFRKPWSNDLV